LQDAAVFFLLPIEKQIAPADYDGGIDDEANAGRRLERYVGNEHGGIALAGERNSDVPYEEGYRPYVHLHGACERDGSFFFCAGDADGQTLDLKRP
jgi:hypothetical protein